MNNIANLLSGLTDSNAPRIMISHEPDGISRWQRVDPRGGFAMLLRIPTEPYHMCGYVLVDANLWNERGTDEIARSLNITYDGPGTKLISWRVPNGAGRLVIPVKLAPEGEADHWLGIDFQSQPARPLQGCISDLAHVYRALKGIGVTR